MKLINIMPHYQNKVVLSPYAQDQAWVTHIYGILAYFCIIMIATYHFLLDICSKCDIVAICLPVNQIK